MKAIGLMIAAEMSAPPTQGLIVRPNEKHFMKVISVGTEAQERTGIMPGDEIVVGYFDESDHVSLEEKRIYFITCNNVWANLSQ